MIPGELLVAKDDVRDGGHLESRVGVSLVALVQPDPFESGMVKDCWTPTLCQSLLGVCPASPVHIYGCAVQAIAKVGEALENEGTKERACKRRTSVVVSEE